jgi:hypothetical protein
MRKLMSQVAVSPSNRMSIVVNYQSLGSIKYSRSRKLIFAVLTKMVYGPGGFVAIFADGIDRNFQMVRKREWIKWLPTFQT